MRSYRSVSSVGPIQNVSTAAPHRGFCTFHRIEWWRVSALHALLEIVQVLLHFGSTAALTIRPDGDLCAPPFVRPVETGHRVPARPRIPQTTRQTSRNRTITIDLQNKASYF
jgi:hypothetical protein